MNERGKPTAIAAVELGRRKNEPGGGLADYRDVWFLEHLPERSDKAMRQMAQIIDDSATRDSRNVPILYVNVTGPGKPALQMLRFNEVTPTMRPVYLIDGDERVEANGAVKLGKGCLVSGLQELFGDGKLQFLESAKAVADQLKQELLRDHEPGDEPGPLMIALGLAVQEKEKKTRNTMRRVRTF